MRNKQNKIYGLLLFLVILMTSGSNLWAEGSDVTSVLIGKQVWMQENLNVSHYRNGDPIRYAGSNKEWLDAASKGEGAWCYEKYGRLYNWFAVNDPRGLAPSGWHVPSDQEWKALTEVLGGEAIAGGKMKSTSSALWNTPNINASNSSYFSALPAGLRGDGGNVYFVGESAYFWSSLEAAPKSAWYRVLNYHNSSAVRGGEDKEDGMSVRCVKDLEVRCVKN